MGHWNYRLVQRQDGFFAVHEVYYNKRGEAWAMTSEAVDIGPFDDKQEVMGMLMMVNADVRRRPIFVEPAKGEWAKPDWEGRKRPLRAVEKELLKKARKENE